MTEELQRRRPPESVAEQVVRRGRQPIKDKEPRVDFFSTGSTLLNLAASQKGRSGGWARGRIINIVGDGSSGKTLLALEALAQAYHRLPRIKSKIWPTPRRVHLAYNNVEGVMDMPIEHMYGDEVIDAIEWIPEEGSLMTCEGFGRDLLRRIEELPQGEALVYVLDSIDALTTEPGVARMNKAIKDDKPLEGSYGSGPERAKYFSSEFFGNLCSRMAGKDATVFMISQLRQKLDAVNFGEKYYRTGGKALDFYTHQVVWLAQVAKLTNEHNKQKRAYGVRVRARFKRNKVAVPFREADFNILFDYGVDDIGSCAEALGMDYLRALAGENKISSREDFCQLADNNPPIRESLLQAVETEWAEIEANTRVTRNKNRWEDESQ